MLMTKTQTTVAFFLGLVTANLANAMEVDNVAWRDRQVLLLTGPIVRGDAAKVAEKLKLASDFPHGVPVVLLDSPGGSVTEALFVSKLFEQRGVHTVIPNGATCASACASIVFISGTYRTVEEGGYFGQHSCSVGGKEDQACNDLISEHALAHGVSYGAVSAFTTFVPAKDIQWFDRTRVDCWEISRYPFSFASGYEKFDPCAIRLIKRTDSFPQAQSAWRIDFLGAGYRAFQRTVHDHEPEMELSIFCRNDTKGSLYLGMRVKGDTAVIRENVSHASLSASPIQLDNLQVHVVQVSEKYSQVLMQILPTYVNPLLRDANRLELVVHLRKPFENMIATTYLSNSRKALLFAANNCVN
jgi:hypothetical protein